MTTKTAVSSAQSTTVPRRGAGDGVGSRSAVVVKPVAVGVTVPFVVREDAYSKLACADRRLRGEKRAWGGVVVVVVVEVVMQVERRRRI